MGAPSHLIEAADVGVVSGQVLAEQDEVGGAQQHTRRPKGRGDDLQVAQSHLADLGLRDGVEGFGQRRCWPSRLSRGALTDPNLVAGLMEAEQPSLVVAACIPTDGAAASSAANASKSASMRELRSLRAQRHIMARPPRVMSRVQLALQPKRRATSLIRATSSGWRSAHAAKRSPGVLATSKSRSGTRCSSAKHQVMNGQAPVRSRSARRPGVGRVIHAARSG